METAIEHRELERIQFVGIRETDTKTGDTQKRILPEIDGKLLFPVSEANKLGITPRTIRRYAENNKLELYYENGQPATRNSRGRKVFFNLHAWLNLNFEDPNGKPRKRKPRTFVIRRGEGKPKVAQLNS